MIFALAWRNLWRRPVRTALSLLTIALAAALLVFMLSFQLGVYDTMKMNTLKVFDGLAQIQPKGYVDDPDIRKTLRPQPILEKIASIQGINAAGPRASSYGILANGDLGYGAAVVGVDPSLEPLVSTLPSTVRVGRYLEVADHDAIVMGAALAKNLNLSVGDRVTLLGSAKDGTVAADSLELVGIFTSGVQELDRQMTQIPLKRFQETFVMEGSVNLIALSGDRLAAVEAALPALAQVAADNDAVVLDWVALQPALKQAIRLDFSTSMMLYATLVIVVVFIILNTLLMSVLERTREFGMLLAIGMRPGLAAQMIWLELLLLAGLGSLIGLVLGGGVTWWLEQTGIVLSGMSGILAQYGLPERLFPTLSLQSGLIGPAAILISVALGGLIPMVRIHKLEPVLAMKEG